MKKRRLAILVALLVAMLSVPVYFTYRFFFYDPLLGACRELKNGMAMSEVREIVNRNLPRNMRSAKQEHDEEYSFTSWFLERKYNKPDNLPSPILKWQKTTELRVGFEDGRVDAETTYITTYTQYTIVYYHDLQLHETRYTSNFFSNPAKLSNNCKP